MNDMSDGSRHSLDLRAAEALRLARRLAPGPDRNELRQVARTLRALAKLVQQKASDAESGV